MKQFVQEEFQDEAAVEDVPADFTSVGLVTRWLSRQKRIVLKKLNLAKRDIAKVWFNPLLLE